MGAFSYQKIYLFNFMVVIICFVIQISAASLCTNFTYNFINESASAEKVAMISINLKNHRNYSCPGTDNPVEHTECCSKAGMNGCCPPPEIRYFYQIDQVVATVVAITVVLIWASITITLITCCFYSNCPLYTSCKAERSPEIPTYGGNREDISMDTMPVELSSKNCKFSPVKICNGNLDADNNPV